MHVSGMCVIHDGITENFISTKDCSFHYSLKNNTLIFFFLINNLYYLFCYVLDGMMIQFIVSQVFLLIIPFVLCFIVGQQTICVQS